MTGMVEEHLGRRFMHQAEKTAVNLVHELFVAILGAWLPGILFVVAIVISAFFSCHLLKDLALLDDKFLSSLKSAFDNLHLEIVAVLLVVAYVTGHFFFRHGPKIPDSRSVVRAWCGMVNSRSKMGEFELPMKVKCRAHACQTSPGHAWAICRCCSRILCLFARTSRWILPVPLERYVCRPHIEGGEFPYLYLKNYLRQRGLDHLAQLVPWDGTTDAKREKRSKIYINILKNRVESALPSWSKSISLNEGHVRLMSSTWFLARTMCRYCLLLAASFVLLGVLSSLFVDQFPQTLRVQLPSVLRVAGVHVVMLVGAIWAMRTVEDFLLYQRIREIMYILDAAYFASVTFHDLRIFEGLGVPAPSPAGNPLRRDPTGARAPRRRNPDG